jgi:Uma2 family endonuclease
MATAPEQIPYAAGRQPAWEIALLYPDQGKWREFDYLDLDTNQLVELVDGNLEVLPVPTYGHQQIVWYLAERLREFVSPRTLGGVVFAPMPVRIRDRTFREPDVVFFPKEQGVRPEDNYLRGAGLVIEVVSPDDKSHKRDYEEKRRDYAQLRIPEYWIVDPQTEQITVLSLKDKQYSSHGAFVPGQQATSTLLKGMSIDVSAVFEAGRKTF